MANNRLLDSGLPYPADWPPQAYYVPDRSITSEQVAGLRSLVDRNSAETALDQYIHQNQALLTRCLKYTTTGHHGSWVIPKQAIRPPEAGVAPGLIPDFIVGGKSSDGFAWYVVELKGSDASMFSDTDSRLTFSQVVNRGVCQLLEYIDYCASAQAYLRDTLRLTGFREPGGFLIVGRGAEFEHNTRRQQLKAAWNRRMGNAIEIRTWDGLLRDSQDWMEKYLTGSE